MELRSRVSYHGVGSANPATASPITFHCNIFRDEISYSLYHGRRDKNKQWKRCSYRNICLGLADDPNIKVNITYNKDFVSLCPGESQTTSLSLDNEVQGFPNDLQPEDVFWFVFKGVKVGYYLAALLNQLIMVADLSLWCYSLTGSSLFLLIRYTLAINLRTGLIFKNVYLIA